MKKNNSILDKNLIEENLNDVIKDNLSLNIIFKNNKLILKLDFFDKNKISKKTAEQIALSLEKNLDIDSIEINFKKNNDQNHKNSFKKEEEQIIKEIFTKNRTSMAKKSETLESVDRTRVEKIKNINNDYNSGKNVIIEGDVFTLKRFVTKSKKLIITFGISDDSDSIFVKSFYDPNDKMDIKINDFVRVKGKVIDDKFLNERVLQGNMINKIKKTERIDKSKEKRTELHLHTKMSSMDGITSAKKYIETAAKWGHKSIAITDHGVIQSFPEAYEASIKNNIKVLLGVEAYLANDDIKVISKSYDKNINDETFVVFDIETTGLSPLTNEIIEIGAVKIKGKKITDKFSTFVKPKHSVPYNITKLTGITNEMLTEAPAIEEVLKDFISFTNGCVLVAHNAEFDIGFINKNIKELGALENPYIDTLTLSRLLLKKLKNHKLKTICKYFNIKIDNHHRAKDDATATGILFIKLLGILEQKEITNLSKLNSLKKFINKQHLKSFHFTILAKNKTGLKNLYKLVTLSHIKYFHRTPKIPVTEIANHRDGLLLGSGCQSGELFQDYLKGIDEKIIVEKARKYDYIEIQPLSNNNFLIEKGIVKDENQLMEINKNLIKIGRKLNIPIVATGDVHYLNPSENIYRKILMHNKGFDDIDGNSGLFLKTTEEMMEDFKYLGNETAKEVVIENPKIISDQIEVVEPMPKELFTPVIEGADDIIEKMAYQKAKFLYGNNLPEIVDQRLKKELNAIIENGFSVIYLVSHKIVRKSLDDSYLVGSRGSVGSSLVATMSDITEVNPLPPHYYCLNCKYNEFYTDNNVTTGPDLPDKNCPNCNMNLNKDGFNIPFEVFMGFQGNKVPDIDLNFSGEYQSIAHKYTENLFGKDFVYRAGTIGTIAEKTAYGFVKSYYEDNNLNLNKAEIERLVQGCSGVKRTTGQHPGGLMIVPKYKDIFDFTPVQFPADDKSSNIKTTHFDYHAISNRLLKLDILGHDDPTALKMLYDLTGVNPKEIPLDDKKTMSIFSDTFELGFSKNDTINIGSLGIPEFGTKFVRQMLDMTKPKKFAELIRISGLSHGTDVWLNNAKDIISNGTTTLDKVISTRDDIMINLMNNGISKNDAFNIMEKVRKGKGINNDEEKLMKKYNIPDWFVESCKKIKYMFPKAHAVAYVIMAFRIAYYKVYFPREYYATFFTIKVEDFDIDEIMVTNNELKNKINEIDKKGNNATTKEKNMLTLMEVAYEMNLREITFSPVNLYKSDSDKFKITNNQLLPPLKTLQGLGESAAKRIVASRSEKQFISIEDLQKRAKLTKPAIDALKKHGCLNSLQETNQLTFLNIAK